MSQVERRQAQRQEEADARHKKETEVRPCTSSKKQGAASHPTNSQDSAIAKEERRSMVPGDDSATTNHAPPPTSSAAADAGLVTRSTRERNSTANASTDNPHVSSTGGPSLEGQPVSSLAGTASPGRPPSPPAIRAAAGDANHLKAPIRSAGTQGVLPKSRSAGGWDGQRIVAAAQRFNNTKLAPEGKESFAPGEISVTCQLRLSCPLACAGLTSFRAISAGAGNVAAGGGASKIGIPEMNSRGQLKQEVSGKGDLPPFVDASAQVELTNLFPSPHRP